MSTLSRIGAIGDIHQEDLRLAAALKVFASANLDRVVAVGDIVDGPGDLQRCLQLLEDARVEVVGGNHDRWFLDKHLDSRSAQRPIHVIDYLRALPSTRDYQTTSGPMQLCHGLGENDMNKLTEDDFGYALENNFELQDYLRSRKYRYVINGHSHRRMVKDFGGVININVGTLFREHDPCFAVIDFAAQHVDFHLFDERGEVRSDVQRVEMP